MQCVCTGRRRIDLAITTTDCSWTRGEREKRTRGVEPPSLYYSLFFLPACLLLLSCFALSWLKKREEEDKNSLCSPPLFSKKKKKLSDRPRPAPTPPSPRSPPCSPSGTTSSRRRTPTRLSRSTPRRACCSRRCPTLPGERVLLGDFFLSRFFFLFPSRFFRSLRFLVRLSLLCNERAPAAAQQAGLRKRSKRFFISLSLSFSFRSLFALFFYFRSFKT